MSNKDSLWDRKSASMLGVGALSPNLESSSNPGVTQLELDLGTTSTILEETFRAVVQRLLPARIAQG